MSQLEEDAKYIIGDEVVNLGQHQDNLNYLARLQQTMKDIMQKAQQGDVQLQYHVICFSVKIHELIISTEHKAAKSVVLSGEASATKWVATIDIESQIIKTMIDLDYRTTPWFDDDSAASAEDNLLDFSMAKQNSELRANKHGSWQQPGTMRGSEDEESHAVN